MGTVYVSFRREDAADVVARVLDRLRERFGMERVLDNESRLQPGQTPGPSGWTNRCARAT